MAKIKTKKIKLRLKNRTVIIIGIAGVLLVAGMILSIWQWNNITAFRYRITYSPDELSTKIEENEQKIAEIMNQTVTTNVRDLTNTEKELLASNDITKEEAIRRLVEDADQGTLLLTTRTVEDETSTTDYNGLESEKKNLPVDSVNEIPPILPAVPPTNRATEANSNKLEEPIETDLMESKLTELIAEAYVLRAYYSSQLEGMRASATAEYKALSTEEQTQQRKMTIGMNYIDRAGALEAECDGLMDNLIARIESELQQTGGDTSIIKDIRSYYAEEKSLKKAYYMSLYS